MRRALSITASSVACATLAALSVLCASAPVLAQPSDEAFQRQVDTALEHYNARRYAEAAQAFEAAFEMRNDPELLYNAARSLERGLRRDDAIAMYERFLSLPGSTADLRNRATASVQALRAERDAATRPPDTAGGGSGGAELGAGGGSSGGVDDRRPSGRRRSSRARILEWVLVGGGGVLIGIGSVFGVIALTENTDFEDEMDVATRRSLAQDIDRNALLADVFIGSGIAAAGIGVILLIAGGGDDDEEASAFAPIITPTGGGFRLRSTF